MTTPTLNNIISKGMQVFAVSLLLSCGSETTNTTMAEADSKATVSTGSDRDNGFYDIPSPVDEVQLLQKAGVTYDKSLLNSIENISKFTVDKSKALNLGIFGADMSYAAVFNQPQEAILYLDATKKLADELKIKGDFYNGIMLRIGNSANNKDSLKEIISDVFRLSNQSLKENDQSHLSALVIVGSFIEALYIGTQGALKVKDNKAIYERISEMKGSLSNLVALITTVHDSDFSDVLDDLKSIKAIYYEKPEARLSEDQIMKLTKQVKAIRIRIANS